MHPAKLSVILLLSLPVLAAAGVGGIVDDVGAPPTKPAPPAPCPAPIIKSLLEGAVFTKPDIWVQIQPAGSTKPPVESARVRIEKVGGGFSTQFDMDFNYNQGLSYLFPKKEDGTFEENTHGTYKLTARIGSEEVPSPACLESARTFKIAAPEGPKNRERRIIPPMRDERKPRPTDPPPVEQQRLGR